MSNILEENKRIMSAITKKYNMREKIANKAIELGIKAINIKSKDKLDQYNKSDNNTMTDDNGLQPNMYYYKGDDGQPDINKCIAEQEKNGLSHTDSVTYCGLLFKGVNPDDLMKGAMKSASLEKLPAWMIASNFDNAKTK
jgi:hypothetical protein